MVKKYVYKLPKTNEKTRSKSFDIKQFDELCTISNDFKDQLGNIPIHKWTNAKYKSNEYEMVFSTKCDKLCQFRPISRSFFKLWEILVDYKSIIFQQRISSVCFLAEGPGGFIEAFDKYCTNNNIHKPLYHCMTLTGKNKKIPKLRLDQLPRINIHCGKDGTGDLYNTDNIDYLADQTGKCQLVTADGGFDITAEGGYSMLEKKMKKLICSEIYTALRIQDDGGTFILKVFDTYSIETLSLINILNNVYTTVRIVKPLSSRPANSEKYLMCTGFQKNHIRLSGYLTTLRQIIKDGIFSRIHLPPPNFLNAMLHYTICNLISQMISIWKTLGFIDLKDPPVDISKCIRLCQKYNLGRHDSPSDPKED